MAALPMDLLVDFSQRPVGIDLQEYATQSSSSSSSSSSSGSSSSSST